MTKDTETQILTDLATIKGDVCHVKKTMERRLANLEHAIYGNGEDKPGIRIEVDRLNQQSKFARHWVNLVVAALLMMLIGSVYVRITSENDETEGHETTEVTPTS